MKIFFEITDINYILLQESRLGFNLYSNILFEKIDSTKTIHNKDNDNNTKLAKFEEYNFNKIFFLDRPNSLINEDMILKSTLILG